MILSIKKALIFLLTLLCFCKLSAQESGLHFDQVNYDEDFSPSMISSMLQSEKGFIWIGTKNGLFRYDGYSFNRYIRNKQIKGSLSNNHINMIFEDSNENLWIGTNHGLNFFNKNSNNFITIDISSAKGGENYISSFAEDQNKTIWVGTFGGVKRLNLKTNKLNNINDNPNFELNSSRVLSLFYDKEWGLLAGTSQGLKHFDPTTLKSKKLPNVFYNNPDFLKAKIWKIVKTKTGDLWFASETMGAFLYSKSKNAIIQYKNDSKNANSIASNWINDIVQLNNGTMWFATKDGLSVYNSIKNNFTNYKHNPLNNFSLSDNDLNCFLKDNNGCIWTGTTAGGINFYNKSNTNFSKIGETLKPQFGLNNALVHAIVKENNDALWVGTYGGGLNYLDLKNNISTSYKIDNDDKKTKNLVTAIINKDSNTLVFGTFNGLFQFNKTSKTFKKIPLSANGLIEDERPITSLIMDNGTIWVGTNGNGLKKIAPNGEVENYRKNRSPNSLSDNFIMDLENRKEGIWITTTNGLNYFDKKLEKVSKLFRSKTKKPIDNNSLTTLFTDSKNRLWIGADYDGLYYLNESNDTFLTLNKAKGLTDATIKSVTEDAEGNLWVSSEDFLFKIKIKNDSINLKDSDFEITRFSVSDGVSVKQFSYNSGIQINENKLAFGSSKGLLLFNTQSLIKASNNSAIVFTKLIVNNEIIESGQESTILNKPISETSQITINYDQGYIGLEFSSLNFVNPKKSNYAYKLDYESTKDQWHLTGTQNRINLSNLNHGTYNLSVKSTNDDGSWNPKVKTLKIIILPPWWKTWWAYSLYVILFLLFNYTVYRFIQNRIKLKRELFLEHVENERKQEILNMQLNFFTNISHEIRTPLTLIKGPVEELLTATNNDLTTKTKLKMIQQNSDRLLKLVNELLDFRKAEEGHMKIYCEKQDIISFCFEIFESFKVLAVEKNIEYKFVLNSHKIPVYFDQNQMEKVLFNLLSNAFKFTKKNGKIVLAVEEGTAAEKKVFIKIKDNGIGIPEESKDNIFNNFFQVDDRGTHNMGSGVGLALSKSIVELHKGEITILNETESWTNTVFQIELLLGHKHLTQDQILKSDGTNNEPIITTKKTIETDNTSIGEDSNEEFDTNKKTLLVVEDNDEVRTFLINVLNEEYNIIDFPNGKEAVSFMEKEIPDLIISDIMMPEMDGLELCAYIKTNESTNHIPVILLTAKASIDNKIEGLSTGADAYISKPFSTQILKLSIQNLLSSKEILKLKYSGNFIVDSDLDKLTTPEEIFIKKLMRIIEENIENPELDVNMLVNEIGMSRTILYKKVNTLTNHSVASLIKHLRLKKASDIILNTSYPISEVAFLVGFSDRKHFSREFKKVYKASPSVYKNTNSPTE
ncbi:two-component regulator propeller domain-containing protein [Flavobacterium ovatum]|uniref:hybrid sensor histidine kinase/response regulator n=1 Tax=Flavobacterium ovatum TaxID=1928857 RepID=UPI00344DBD55